MISLLATHVPGGFYALHFKQFSFVLWVLINVSLDSGGSPFLNAVQEAYRLILNSVGSFVGFTLFHRWTSFPSPSIRFYALGRQGVRRLYISTQRKFPQTRSELHSRSIVWVKSSLVCIRINTWSFVVVKLSSKEFGYLIGTYTYIPQNIYNIGFILYFIFLALLFLFFF